MKRLSPANKKLQALVLRGSMTDSVFGVKNLLKLTRHCFPGGEDECVGKKSRGPSVDESKQKRLAHNPQITVRAKLQREAITSCKVTLRSFFRCIFLSIFFGDILFYIYLNFLLV